MKKLAFIAITLFCMSGTALAQSSTGKSGAEIMSLSTRNADTVRDVQQQLSQRGHSPGDVDGKWGPKTENALKDFQRSQNIRADGRLNMQTASALGIEQSPRARYGGEKKEEKMNK